MSTIRNPVGPQPPAVYWKRRAIVLIGLLAVIVIILLIVFRPGSGAPTPTDLKTPAASNAAVDEGEAPDCTAEQVQLTAVTDKDSYQAGELPQLSMTITNLGAAPCSINAGTDAQEYVVTSGSEQYWNSRDCETNPVEFDVVLDPGVPKSPNPLSWERTRSSVDTCEGERPAVPGGGASYHLTVKLGDLVSADSKQFQLF